ncbi:Importin subunit beta-2 [Wickerhamomyces ciferrii]|uniref:Importin subunit beta-2 n=1 Tax=Wickerhamomyces ciferrii (strain ATCC 14091 / BCRC 22168 / CBS 111 / JCM 3599 / NBRC 0793 / NRRL Y-1031 F-60-10) TaxID=1206466 RepID=K0KSU7_WICCF|nr:Importin subunit beta-2 [Wickerhamomyces ciferrii]CCH44449.1 Importin subunit beta-2 [Wickerhamomyces ciferrii]
MSWEPNPTSVEQLKQILAGTLYPNAQQRQQATEALDQAKHQEDFHNYLLYILVHDNSTPSEVRASAGVNLKNDMIKNFNVKNNDYLLENILKGLLVDDAFVRNITGTVITSIFSTLGISKWPQVLPQLIELSETGNITSQEASTSALAKICEDSSHILDTEYNGQRPLDFMVPKFLQLTASESSKVRANTLHCLNQIILTKTQSFLIHIDEFLSRLFALATDQDPSVRRNVCIAFANVLEVRPDRLLPHLDGCINYSLHSITSSEDEVALEACEFLLSLATSDIPSELIKNYLSTILPVLLKSMVYSEMDIFLMDNRDDDDVEDKDEDIKPTNAKVKSSHTTKNTNNNDNDDNDDDDEDDDDEEGDYGVEWSLRKCSAATLDVLSSVSPAEVLQIVLPILRENIGSNEWPVREAAILAFGAVAEGGIEFASNQLPALVPFLVERLQDTESSVRQITCWTLGRYSSWICSEAHKGGLYSNYFAPTFQSIVSCTLDKKKMVQESACSSLAQFIENSESELIQPFAQALVENFQQCFQKYQRKNLVVLYDAIQTFVERIEIDDESIQAILPPLLKKWEILNDEDKELWPLLECMSSVAASLGEKFAPYAIQVYQRSIRILEHCITLDKQVIQDPTINTPEKDFIVTSLDLIDGLCQGLTEHSGELIDEHLIRLLLECFNDPTDDVRQSAYALLGDIAIYIPNTLGSYLDQVILSIDREILARNFDSYAVVNNATWALGEISLRINLNKYLEKLVGTLIDLLNSNSTTAATVLENSAITIGRIGINSPEFFSTHIQEFLLEWSKHMLYLEENEEKETAFQGICNIISANPTGFNNESLIAFVNSITMYLSPGQKLAEIFQKLLIGYKEMLGDNWSNFLQTIDNPEELRSRYGI